MLSGLGENATTIERIIDDLSYSRCVGVYVHTVACAEMTQNSLRRDLQRPARQFRIATSLDMVDPLNPLIKRQVSIKSHGYVWSSRTRFSGFLIAKLDALTLLLDADPSRFARSSGSHGYCFPPDM